MNTVMSTATLLLVAFAGTMILGLPILIARTTQRPVTRGGKLRRGVLLLVPEAAGWGILFQAIAMATTKGGYAAHQMTGMAQIWYWAGLACTILAFAAMVAVILLLALAAVQRHLAERHETAVWHWPHRQPAH